MSHDALLRCLAVVAAAALVVGPYWRDVAGYVSAAYEATFGYRRLAARVAAAALLIAAAWGKVPLPSLPSPGVAVNVETPGVEMQALVKPVASALASMPMSDRMLWASVWNKAAVVVAGDAVSSEVVFTDTRSLRAFTTLCLDIAWRRLGQHVPGSNEPLRSAVEDAYGQVLGTDVVPVGADLRGKYAAFAKAVAWAGLNGG